jgi:hypothetical protein
VDAKALFGRQLYWHVKQTHCFCETLSVQATV